MITRFHAGMDYGPGSAIADENIAAPARTYRKNLVGRLIYFAGFGAIV